MTRFAVLVKGKDIFKEDLKLKIKNVLSGAETEGQSFLLHILSAGG